MHPTRNIFTAVVITANAGSRSVTVARESYGTAAAADMGNMLEGLVVSTTISTFLGFKDSTLPQPGSRVLCVEDSSSSCFVVGSIPQASLELKALPGRAALGAGCAMDEPANRIGHEAHTRSICDLRRPSDIVDGEYGIANELGVLIGLYQQMAVLKASELAQVQCFLLDDLVRIISHNFQHYTALGEYSIFHDGKRLMAEFGATHKAPESYGSPAVTSDNGSIDVFGSTGSHKPDDSDDFYELKQDERMRAIERFKMFLGSVGDFLHLFLVRPNPTAPRVLNGDVDSGTTETGLWNTHIGTDGGMHIRSVKEIFIEKTNWIRVPVRQRAPDDPEGDDARNLDYKDKKPFEFNTDFKYKGNPIAYALQIRDYLAYVNEKSNYQNFKAHEKDFFVNDDVEGEEHVGKFTKIDQETTSTVNQYELKTAGIYLMPNGGITIRDAWNSAIILEGGNVYIQPAKDLVMQPLRHSVTKAGNSVITNAKKHIDFSSTEEGLRVKTEKSQYFYADKGGMVLEANGENDTAGEPSPKDEAIEYIGGIVFKSKLSIYNYAEKNIVNYAKKNLYLQSLENTDILADKALTLYGKKNNNILSDGRMLCFSGKSTTVASEGGAVFAGASNTVLGQDSQNLGVTYDKKSKYVDIIKGSVKVSDIAKGVKELTKFKDEILKNTTFEKEEKFKDLKFKFLKSEKYKLSKEQDAIPMTLAQQDSELTELYNLTEWEEKKINETYPFPGKEMFEEFFFKGEAPVNLEKKSVSKDYTNKADPEGKPGKIKLDSLNSYKVQV